MLIIPSAAAVLMAWITDPKSNLFVRNPDAVAAKITKLIEDGASRLHVVTDFDMTLTQYWVDGKRSISTHGVLDNFSKMPPASKECLGALYKKYYPIEVSPTIPFNEKVKAMEEWWASAHDVIVDLKLTHQDFRNMVVETPVTFRPKTAEFLDLAHSRGVPLLIFSAGLADVITEILLYEGFTQDNIDVVSNKMRFENGIVVGFHGPLIHTFNKNEAVVANTEHSARIAGRKNIILMGDSLGDLRMADKMENSVKLTIGFLNHDKDLLLDQYADAFDIVVLDDAPLDLPIMLLSSIA